MGRQKSLSPPVRSTIQIVETTGGGMRHIKKLTVAFGGEEALRRVQEALKDHLVTREKKT